MSGLTQLCIKWQKITSRWIILRNSSTLWLSRWMETSGKTIKCQRHNTQYRAFFIICRPNGRVSKWIVHSGKLTEPNFRSLWLYALCFQDLLVWRNLIQITAIYVISLCLWLVFLQLKFSTYYWLHLTNQNTMALSAFHTWQCFLFFSTQQPRTHGVPV